MILGKSTNDRRNACSSEKDASARPLLKLKQQEDVIKRELTAAISHMKIDSNILQDVEKYLDEVTRARETFLGNLCERLEEIRTELKSVKCAAELPEETKRLDVNTYKERLIKLSQRIQDFNKCCSIESLSQESSVLESDLNEFNLNLKKYCHTPKSAISRSATGKKDKQTDAVNYKEVEDFHALVAKTGHSEGWSEEDHLLFINTRRKCNNISGLVAAIQLKCPDLSIETIINHEAWYRKYLELREKQRCAVLRWRREKTAEKEQRDESPESPESAQTEESVENNYTKVKVIPPWKKGNKVPAERKSSESTDSDRSRTKELLKRWKIEKESQRAEEEEQARMRLESRRLFEESRKERKMQKIRNALSEYRWRKAIKIEAENLSKKPREKCPFDPTLVKAFREQDKEYTKRKKDLISRSQKPRKTEVNLTKRAATTRSCTTLFNPTEIWIAKCRMDQQTEKGGNNVHYIKDVPKLSTKWRNEESIDLRSNVTSA